MGPSDLHFGYSKFYQYLSGCDLDSLDILGVFLLFAILILFLAALVKIYLINKDEKSERIKAQVKLYTEAITDLARNWENITFEEDSSPIRQEASQEPESQEAIIEANQKPEPQEVIIEASQEPEAQEAIIEASQEPEPQEAIIEATRKSKTKSTRGKSHIGILRVMGPHNPNEEKLFDMNHLFPAKKSDRLCKRTVRFDSKIQIQFAEMESRW